MAKYIAEVIDHLNWEVKFEAPDNLTKEELLDYALKAWGDENAEGDRTFRFDTQDVTTVLKLPE